jgi:hypothetical protein
MRVDDLARKAVVFVGSEIAGKFIPLGTGFLAGVRHQNTPLIFVVTADHVIDLIATDSIAVRMNRASGDAAIVKSDKQRVIRSSDRSDDLAVFPLPPTPNVYDHTSVLLDREDYKKILGEIWKPELGDEIVTAGLYTSQYGSTKNVPVVRIGHIAMLPDEPVLSHRGIVKAYLVEVKSIAGLSGSPVYINLPHIVVVNGRICIRDGSSLICIGVMLGYHLVASVDDQIFVPQTQGEEVTSEFSLDERNTGFAVVAPIEKLFDIMDRRDVQKIMDAEIEWRKNSEISPAAVPLKGT